MVYISHHFPKKSDHYHEYIIVSLIYGKRPRLLLDVYCCEETPPESVYPLVLLSLLVTFFGNSIDWMTTSDRLRGDFVKSGYSALEVTWPDSWCCQVTFTHKSQQCRMKTINPLKHTTLKDLSNTLSYFLVTWDSDPS